MGAGYSSVQAAAASVGVTDTSFLDVNPQAPGGSTGAIAAIPTAVAAASSVVSGLERLFSGGGGETYSGHLTQALNGDTGIDGGAGSIAEWDAQPQLSDWATWQQVSLTLIAVRPDIAAAGYQAARLKPGSPPWPASNDAATLTAAALAAGSQIGLTPSTPRSPNGQFTLWAPAQSSGLLSVFTGGSTTLNQLLLLSVIGIGAFLLYLATRSK